MCTYTCFNIFDTILTFFKNSLIQTVKTFSNTIFITDFSLVNLFLRRFFSTCVDTFRNLFPPFSLFFYFFLCYFQESQVFTPFFQDFKSREKTLKTLAKSPPLYFPRVIEFYVKKTIPLAKSPPRICSATGESAPTPKESERKRRLNLSPTLPQ